MYEGNVILIDGYKQGRMENLSDTRHIYNMNEIKEGEKVDDLLKAYIEKVDRDQDSLREDIRESERRTEKRIQDSENRMDKRLDKIEELISSQNEKFDKIGEKIIDLDETVRDRLEDHKRFLWGIALSVIIGIAGMVIAVIIA